MKIVTSIELEPNFGHWLAGFIDGEGCFSIYKVGSTYSPRFEMHLRDDDSPIVLEIYEKLGELGRISYSRSTNSSKPQIRWHIHSKFDCLHLVSILDKFSLRAKKLRDYNVWREAVLTWNRLERTGSQELKPFYEHLQEIRQYREHDT